MATIEERVIGIVAEQFCVEKGQITREWLFINDLRADPREMMDLVMELEEEFDINIPGAEAEGITTVGQAVDVVIRLVAERESADRNQITLIKSMCLGQIDNLKVDPKPTYRIGHQHGSFQMVSWNRYLEILEHAVAWCDQQLAAAEVSTLS